MRILYFTDTHIRGNNPKSRKDNFVDTLKEKLEELVRVSQECKVDYIFFGGDLFDRPDVSPSIVKEFIAYFMGFPQPIYAISGNHDVYGQNPSTINRTVLGILDAVGIVKLLSLDERVYLEKDGVRLQLTGCPYYYDVDVNRQGYIVDKVNCDYAINLVHGFLLDRPFIEGIPYTLIDDICQKTSADITICGHYHTGFGIKKIEGKYFINPGSLSRVSNVSSEMNRIPSYLMIDLGENIDIKLVKLKCAKPGDEVLDKTQMRQEEFRRQKLNEFVSQVNSYGSFEILNLQKIINDISLRDSIPLDIKDEAIRRIADAQALIASKEVSQ